MKQAKFIIITLCVFLSAALMQGHSLAEAEIDMLSVEHKLYELGYRDENCDGAMDEMTVRALKNFQRVNGLTVTGEADAETIELLMSGSALDKKNYLSGVALMYSEMPNLELGAFGNDVSKLQKALKELGYFGGVSDGAYGEATELAVSRFQKANGLEESGIADGKVFMRLYEGAPISWENFLDSCCAVAGDSGAHVRSIQSQLKRMGYFNGECTGRYGDGTQQAIRLFQTKNKLEVTGDADELTCEMLFSDSAISLIDFGALQRGATGTLANEICQALIQLGYPAKMEFSVQTEIALMQFQVINDLEVTGTANQSTRELLRSDRAKPCAKGDVIGSISEETRNQAVKIATGLLGQRLGFESNFEWLQYVCLKCGIRLFELDQLQFAPLEEGHTLTGELIKVETDQGQYLGIATSDDALIYLDSNGFTVMRYFSSMQILGIYGHGVTEE